MEETLLEVEKKMSNSEIAEYLKDIADKVEKGEVLKLQSEGQEVELETDRGAEFEIKVERDESKGEESLELEIEWKGKSSDLSIG